MGKITVRLAFELRMQTRFSYEFKDKNGTITRPIFVFYSKKTNQLISNDFSFRNQIINELQIGCKACR